MFNISINLIKMFRVNIMKNNFVVMKCGKIYLYTVNVKVKTNKTRETSFENKRNNALI